MTLTLLYRGPLSSCNYGCAYCPFAKRTETPEELGQDADALRRFVSWVGARTHDETSVFFTPWGEALVRRWYRDAITELSHLPRVRRVAVQTNLSAPLGWLDDCDRARVGIWSTYHPGEVSRERFLEKVFGLIERDVRFSVGIVGLKEHFDEIRALRRALPPSVYVWVNAYRRVEGYYSEEDVRSLEEVDPLFRLNTRTYASQGRDCRCGSTVLSVDGSGTARRCHFIEAEVGNIYDAGFEATLQREPCPAASCRCHIGYVHMDDLGLDEVFGEGLLERIPDPRHDLVALREFGKRSRLL
jgi:MoaA/NifB/PqqE/SkfB family radical SAM enzyme